MSSALIENAGPKGFLFEPVLSEILSIMNSKKLANLIYFTVQQIRENVQILILGVIHLVHAQDFPKNKYLLPGIKR